MFNFSRSVSHFCLAPLRPRSASLRESVVVSSCAAFSAPLFFLSDFDLLAAFGAAAFARLSTAAVALKGRHGSGRGRLWVAQKRHTGLLCRGEARTSWRLSIERSGQREAQWRRRNCAGDDVEKFHRRFVWLTPGRGLGHVTSGCSCDGGRAEQPPARPTYSAIGPMACTE